MCAQQWAVYCVTGSPRGAFSSAESSLIGKYLRERLSQSERELESWSRGVVESGCGSSLEALCSYGCRFRVGGGSAHASSLLFILEAVLSAHSSYALISVWDDLSNIWAVGRGILEQCFHCISYSELILLYA